MASQLHLDPRRLREEIAHAAARLIAEEGLDYGAAKRKAARTLLGQVRVHGDWLPNNDTIEAAVREYQSLFQADTQPATVNLLRRVAALLMEALAPYTPYLSGAVLNGTASRYSDIHLQLFCDNPKEPAIFLLNAGVDYEVHETAHFSAHARQQTVETLSFVWRGQWPDCREARGLARDAQALLGMSPGVHLALYDHGDLRGAGRQGADKNAGWPERVDLDWLRNCLNAQAHETSSCPSRDADRQ